ncbi:hypothetical protein [Roseiflexus castenholzii]|jgi:hypothetical protein|uniref:Uncharacterized protein n=1 Tax=Roseiflexus castenholzii (strain DSM 13941 / HLO8) TaxID=383372 RepID=A7NME1_ROSCS|nr:hypothetical protein [Roseiflexus castenholzii]ABU58703.1 conserved hypothetical protein [Roseiflexus castenholzii DSM 13941]
MKQALGARIRSKPGRSCCFRRLSLSLVMGLIVLWPVVAPDAATGGVPTYARLAVQVRRLWDRDTPFVLRHAGIIPQPPEYVAQRVLQALDRHDVPGVMRFVDHSAPKAHQDITEALYRWPPDMLRQPGCWGSVGPYQQEAWFAAVPAGSVRRVPITLSSPRGTHELILLLHFNGRGWRITGAHYRQSPESDS